MTFKHLALAALLSLLAPAAFADSIVLLSVSGNTYTYGYQFTNSTTSYSKDATITITGLSGITAVTASNNASYLGYTSNTSTSITLSNAGNGTFNNAGTTWLLYTVTSTAALTNVGTYTLHESSLTETGSIIQAVTPEPPSVLLLLTGAAFATTLARRQRRAYSVRRPSPSVSTTDAPMITNAT